MGDSFSLRDDGWWNITQNRPANEAELEEKRQTLDAVKEANGKAKPKPTKEQETTAAETMRGADGIYNPAKVNLSKMFSDKANERSYTDEQGNKKSYNKGSKWQAYIDKNITDPAAKADMEKQIHDIVSANPNMSPKELKFRLRSVEANLRRRYPSGVSKNFDISGSMLDSTMAKDLLALGLKGGEQTTQPATEKPAAETPKPETPKGPTTNDDLNAAFKRIKNKQASDADLALFSKYSEEQLKKMGFGPISIAAIKGKKEEPKPTATQTSTQPAQSSDTSDDDAFMKQYTTYAGQRTPEARKFMSDPANVKRYQEILKKRNTVKNNGKIEKLKQELEVHKKIMAENPDRKDIQKAQQAWIDSITKKIEKLSGSVE